MKETRSTILLTRLARKLRKETGDHRYRARAEDEEASLYTLIAVSCTRPLCTLSVPSALTLLIRLKFIPDLLTHEPIVFSISVRIPRARKTYFSIQLTFPPRSG